MVVTYEELISNPTDLALPLAQLLGLPASTFIDSMDGLIPDTVDQTSADSAALNTFFKSQQPMWPLLATALNFNRNNM